VTILSLNEKSGLRIALMPIDELKPHEKGSPVYFELLRQEILKDRVLRYPIIADEKSGVILDGMHRWLTLKSLGYALVPVILIDVFQNPKIQVGRRRVHRYVNDQSREIPIEEVISAGVSGRLMGPRSTRHFFPFSKFQHVDCPLDSLIKCEPQDVSEYLAIMTEQECFLEIEDWYKEIQEELMFLTKRKEEVENEMKEFERRMLNNNMARSCLQCSKGPRNEQSSSTV
jgi:hypothetical protein